MNNDSSYKDFYSGMMFDGSTPIYTGMKKSPQKCRFCGKEEPEVSFDDTSHAISESIGNENFICIDECNSCNHKFSNFEQSFYKAHASTLLLSGIYGKDNGKRKHPYKTFSGSGCKYLFSEKGIVIEGGNLNCSEKDILEIGKISLDPDFKFEKFRHIDIYKSLCKYIVSMLDLNLIDKFSKTCEWLLNNEQVNYLPKVATAIMPPLIKQPRLIYFIRNTDEKKDLPFAIGLLRFAYFVYIFIIPFANDELNFPEENWILDFAKCFYSKADWHLSELNRYNPISPQFPFEIDNIILGETCFLCDKSQLNL